MRQKAMAAGNLSSTPQQTVVSSGGVITIMPANPDVVYVPVYDPWVVWGTPFPPYPGFCYAPPPGIVFGGLAIGFGVGIGIGLWGHWGWGWQHWGTGWHDRAVYYNRARYFTHSRTVINRGFGRPGGPRGFRGRGSMVRPGGGFKRHGGAFNRGPSNRGSFGGNRPRGKFGHSGGAGRPGGVGRPGGGRPSGAHRSGGGHPGSGGHRP